MNGRRGNRNPTFENGDPFAGFGGLGGHQSLISSFFGGRDPFDDPFFTRPFGGLFESHPFGFSGRDPSMNVNPFSMGGTSLLNGYPSGFSSGSNLMNAPHPFNYDNESSLINAHPSAFYEQQSSQTNRSRGPIIEELNSDDEKEVGNEKKDNPRKHSRSSKEGYVEEPDDRTEERKSKQLHYSTEFNSVNDRQSRAQPRSFTFQSSAVTYGGSNGAYYTKSRTLRTGSDGLTVDETKEADSTSGRAAHRLSRGIHDKGHTVTRNLQSDGRVDTMQTLHNLNEDDLAGFEETWKVNARKSLPGWSEGSNVHNGSGSNAQTNQQGRGGWALPSTEPSYLSRRMKRDGEGAAGSSQVHSGRMKMKTNNGE